MRVTGERLQDLIVTHGESCTLQTPVLTARGTLSPRRSDWDPLQALPPGGDAGAGRALALSARGVVDLMKQRAVLSVQSVCSSLVGLCIHASV